MLCKSDIATVGMESKAMASMFMLFHMLAIPSFHLCEVSGREHHKGHAVKCRLI